MKVLQKNLVNTGSKFLKSSAILAVVLVAYCASAAIYRSSFAPKKGVKTFEELKSQNVPMTEASKISNPANHILIFGDVDSVRWTFPSGPPAYLFDQSGKLIDFTLDVGGGFNFLRNNVRRGKC